MLKGHDFRYPQGCVLVEDSVTTAYRNLLKAAALVLILHYQRDDERPGVKVPGYRVHLDPQAEKQLRNAIIAVIAEETP
jgi:hypothetical protein